VFGSWTTPLNPKLCMDPDDVTLALLVFPRMFHERLVFALARDAAAKGVDEGALTKFEVDQIRWVKSLLDPETGWLTQMPQLAERLVPVTARDGEVLVSEADIARVRADWKAACAHARQEYAAMKASNLKHVKRSRDPHATVRPILLLANPLSALAMLCRGLERDMVGLDPEPLAYAARDAFIVGMLAQTGFRKGTVEAMDLDDIRFDETRGKWCLRVPAHRFKNGKSGPYFGTGYGRRHHYERDLLDSYGLYDAIDHYLKTGRGLILGEGRTRALFVVHPVERIGVRTQQYSWCEKGRMSDLPSSWEAIERRMKRSSRGAASLRGCLKFRPSHDFARRFLSSWSSGILRSMCAMTSAAPALPLSALCSSRVIVASVGYAVAST
jgi:integrase